MCSIATAPEGLPRVCVPRALLQGLGLCSLNVLPQRMPLSRAQQRTGSCGPALGAAALSCAPRVKGPRLRGKNRPT